MDPIAFASFVGFTAGFLASLIPIVALCWFRDAELSEDGARGFHPCGPSLPDLDLED